MFYASHGFHSTDLQLFFHAGKESFLQLLFFVNSCAEPLCTQPATPKCWDHAKENSVLRPAFINCRNQQLL